MFMLTVSLLSHGLQMVSVLLLPIEMELCTYGKPVAGAILLPIAATSLKPSPGFLIIIYRKPYGHQMDNILPLALVQLYTFGSLTQAKIFLSTMTTHLPGPFLIYMQWRGL